MLYVLEGLNGVGKTTFISAMEEVLKECGKEYEVITSKPSVEVLKDLNLLPSENEDEDNSIVSKDYLLKVALAYYNKQLELQDSFKDNKIYISDRWFPSTVVYSVYLYILGKVKGEEKYPLEVYRNELGLLREKLFSTENDIPFLSLASSKDIRSLVLETKMGRVIDDFIQSLKDATSSELDMNFHTIYLYSKLDEIEVRKLNRGCSKPKLRYEMESIQEAIACAYEYYMLYSYIFRERSDLSPCMSFYPNNHGEGRHVIENMKKFIKPVLLSNIKE